MEGMTNSSIFEFSAKQIYFCWYDYCLFAIMIGGSVLIGIYFGCFGKKQSTANEYLLAGKTMTVWPVAISLVASHVSGITVLSIPADVYRYGATYGLCFIGISVTALTSAYITMPVFHDLQVTSAYEYLKMRFDTRTRLMASFLFNISVLLFMPIIIYGPALAFAQVTPIDIHLINPIICAVCIFYTSIGGLKTVVWTDTLQFGAMLGAIIAVLWLGITTVGGWGVVFNRSLEGGRLDIDFDLNPTKRDTFWAVAVGWSINWIPHVAINQGAMQKCLSLPTLQDVRKSILIFALATIVCKMASVLTGLIIYATYYNCDPFLLKRIHKNDQLLPYYIMDVATKIPGLPGLFISGVFCAGLSTLSAQMNSLSGTIYEDFVSRFIHRDLTEKQVSNILKIIVVIVGIISTSLVLVVEKLGGILPLSIAISGVTGGSLLGLFLLGMVFPSANSNGAFYGSIISLLFVSFMAAGNRWYQATGELQFTLKPTSVEGCASNLTESNAVVTKIGEHIFPLFRISHYYNTLVGITIVLVIGLSVSWWTKKERIVDERLIAPFMRWAIPKSRDKRLSKHNSITIEELSRLTENK